MCEYNTQDYEIGDQVSSVGEGRYLTIDADDIDVPSDDEWDPGDIIIVGDNLAGVALTGSDSNPDFVVIDTQGVWCLGVNETVAAGAQLYLDPADGTLGDTPELSDIPFGRALTDATYATVPVPCVVQVHLERAILGGELS